MTVKMGEVEENNEDNLLQEEFDNLLEDYEMDLSMPLEDIMYEMFALGWETAMMYSEEEEEE